MRPAVTAEELGEVEYWNFPASGKEIMRVQAALERAKPKGQRVLIGGEANVLKLTKDGIEFSSLGPLNVTAAR
jgi:hypothetical protein